MSSPPIFSNPALFEEQCKTEWELSEEWLRVGGEIIRWEAKGEREIAKQMYENFKLLAYREWRESWKKIDRFGDAMWRKGEE